jgi:hypothetical protein
MWESLANFTQSEHSADRACTGAAEADVGTTARKGPIGPPVGTVPAGSSVRRATMAKKALWRTITGGVAAAAVAIGVAFAVPAAAGTGGQAVVAGPNAMTLDSAVTPDKTAVCDRLKKHQQNRQALQTRLSADANTRGSIAWLRDKAASATASGDAALAKLYTDKAALRSQLLDPLKTVTADLEAVIRAQCS